MSRFTDRVVLVTGAASGIGLSACELFLAEGAHVVAADLRPDSVADGCTPWQVDVSAADEVERMLAEAVRQFGRLDVLCNNAGIGSTADPVSCSVEEWDRVFAVNARGVFLGIKYALPFMLAQGRGAIVNTASAAGLIGLKERTAYCASKGAVVSLTKQVAVQYAGTGVRCNCVCPGTIDSPWVQGLLADSDDPVATRESLVARQPIGRLGTPIEVGHAIVYLASDEAAFVTGSALVIDGGILAT